VKLGLVKEWEKGESRGEGVGDKGEGG